MELLHRGPCVAPAGVALEGGIEEIQPVRNRNEGNKRARDDGVAADGRRPTREIGPDVEEVRHRPPQLVGGALAREQVERQQLLRFLGGDRQRVAAEGHRIAKQAVGFRCRRVHRDGRLGEDPGIDHHRILRGGVGHVERQGVSRQGHPGRQFAAGGIARHQPAADQAPPGSRRVGERQLRAVGTHRARPRAIHGHLHRQFAVAARPAGERPAELEPPFVAPPPFGDAGAQAALREVLPRHHRRPRGERAAVRPPACCRASQRQRNRRPPMRAGNRGCPHDLVVGRGGIGGGLRRPQGKRRRAVGRKLQPLAA